MKLREHVEHLQNRVFQEFELQIFYALGDAIMCFCDL